MVKVMELRLCTDEDLEVLERDLPTGLGRVHQKHLLRAQRHELSYFGAWDGDRAVGTGVIVWDPSRPDRPRGEDCDATVEIAHLQVHPASRGKGGWNRADQVWRETRRGGRVSERHHQGQ